MKMRSLCSAIAVFWLLTGTAAVRAQNRETAYYADAYADHYGVPRALVHAIIEQESGWDPLAQSRKDAEGLMQLMPGTAETYGIRDRYAVMENLSGGIRYLADLLSQFHGDMRLAVAAYYCGPRRILQRGLSYSNPEVVAYVESVRLRYLRELADQTGRRISVPAGEH
jgi:soluble lytic murein transglycosylase-like protein